MAYLFNSGTGFLADATSIGTSKYLFVKNGYLGSVTQSGIDDFGTRVLADGAIIESYSCAADAINGLPARNLGRVAVDPFAIRVEADGGKVNNKACIMADVNELY